MGEIRVSDMQEAVQMALLQGVGDADGYAE